MGYHAHNPQYYPLNIDEDQERKANAAKYASEWFRDLTKPQARRFADRTRCAQVYHGSPMYQREIENARKEFVAETRDADAVAKQVFADMMSCGEISEATNEAFVRVLERQQAFA